MRQLPFQPAWSPSSLRRLPCVAAPACAAASASNCLRLRRRLLPRLDRRRIPRDRARQDGHPSSGRNQRLMQTVPQDGSAGQTRKRPAKTSNTRSEAGRQPLHSRTAGKACRLHTSRRFAIRPARQSECANTALAMKARCQRLRGPPPDRPTWPREHRCRRASTTHQFQNRRRTARSAVAQRSGRQASPSSLAEQLLVDQAYQAVIR